MMDLLSDNDDFVPPTPKVKKKQPLILANSTSLKPNSKNLKKPSQNAKRKKTSGVSPEFKKFKDKAKQVTLFNYIKKELSPIKKLDDSEVNCHVNNPARIKLFSECQKSDSNSTVCNNSVSTSLPASTDSNFDTCTVTNSIKNEMDTSTNIKDDAKNKVSSKLSISSLKHKNGSDLKHVGSCKEQLISSCSFKVPVNNMNEALNVSTDVKRDSEPLETGSYSNKICKDVQNLRLDLDNRIEFTDYSLSSHVLQEINDCAETSDKMNVSSKENKEVVLDSENSISWLDDFDWKACDSFTEKNTSISKCSQKSETRTSK